MDCFLMALCCTSFWIGRKRPYAHSVAEGKNCPKWGKNFSPKTSERSRCQGTTKCFYLPKFLLHVAFAITTGKISAWAMTCFFPDLVQSCTKSLGMLSPIKKLCCFQGSTSTAPWVTDCSESSTAPSVNTAIWAAASDQDCTSLRFGFHQQRKGLRDNVDQLRRHCN